MGGIDLDFYRNLVKVYLERHDYDTGIYWADKVVSLSLDSQQDVYQLAQCYFYGGQYRRAVNLLQKHGFERCNLHFRSLTAKALYAAKDYSKAIEILDLEDKALKPGDKIRKSKWEPKKLDNLMMAQICLIRGKSYEAIMNRILAVYNYKEALRYDVYCYEAYQLLTQHNMLSRMEELDIFEKLSLETQCQNNDSELVRFLYSLNVKSYSDIGMEPSHLEFPLLRKNLDVMTSEAERLFYKADYLQAKKICSQVLAEDPLHSTCLPIYIGTLVELKDPPELFKVAHKLVQQLANTPLGWYSVGSYYYLIGKHDCARRNLNKALCLDPVFGPAWLIFGHSFATEGEHDQAMAAYFKATQLMKGCHLPLLHVGMECGLSNNALLAMRFLEEAITLAPKDPTIRHEMGVIKFHEKKYAEALDLFKQTLEIVEQPRQKFYLKKWEPLYNNLGHVCRKVKKYNEALFYHKKALLLYPSNASTYSAIGLLHAVTGKLDMAVESFHKALSLKRDDAFSNTMLRYVVEKMVEEGKDDKLILS